MKIQGYWLLVLLAASTYRLSAMPALGPETAESYRARFPWDLTLIVYGLALQTNDQAVADAAFYNEVHVLAASTNLEVSQPAMAQLQDIGDEYSITWLDKLEGRPELIGHHALFRRTRDAINQRLQKAPSTPAQILEKRLFRAAIANITCNRLELTLPGYVGTWAAANCSNVMFAAELNRISNQTVPSTNMNFVILTHARAISKAKAYFKLAKPAETRSAP